MDSLLSTLRDAVGPLLHVRRTSESYLVELERAGPWWIKLDQVESGFFTSMVVRTTSGDFGGDRSDLHEALSLLMAAHLTAGGLSVALVDVPHFMIPGAIAARFIIPAQPYLVLADDQVVTKVKSLAETLLLATHVLPTCLGMVGPPSRGDCGGSTQQLSDWAAETRRALRVKPGDQDLLAWRTNPDWHYFRANRADVRVFRAPALAAAMSVIVEEVVRERDVLDDGARGKLMRRGTCRNYVSTSVERRARRLMAALGCPLTELVPLENSVLAVGGDHVVLLASDAGAHAYEEALRETVERHRITTSYLYGSQRFEWEPGLDAERFEHLVRALLLLEPGVQFVSLAGAVNDRDQGRDLVIDKVRPQLDGTVGVNEIPAFRQRVVGQCKVRSRGVGKRDVQDVVDTVERHAAAGYFLAVSTHMTSDLVTFLDGLRKADKMSCEWWTRVDIEDRLRRHPHVLAQFGDLVTASDPSADA